MLWNMVALGQMCGYA